MFEKVTMEKTTLKRKLSRKILPYSHFKSPAVISKNKEIIKLKQVLLIQKYVL